MEIYLVINIHTKEIAGCFKNKEKAVKYINGNIDYSIKNIKPE